MKIANKTLILRIKKELRKIKTRYAAQYGAVIFDIEAEIEKKSIILSGRVLSDRQKKEAFLAARSIAENAVNYSKRKKNARKSDSVIVAPKYEIKNNIKVLSDPNEKMEIGWAIVKDEIIDLNSLFVRKRRNKTGGKAKFKKTIKLKRATQALKNEVVRLLGKKADQCLVQTKDLAVGWVRKDKISEIKSFFVASKLIPEWKGESFFGGKKTPVEFEKAKLDNFLEKYFSSPYLLGGTTVKGIDCSGLAQKFYWEIFGISLPRHSTDQAMKGKEIIFSKAQFGDLVFLRHRAKKYPHIGIIVSVSGKVDEFLILNARREKKGVVIQAFSDILKDYKLINVKKII